MSGREFNWFLILSSWILGFCRDYCEGKDVFFRFRIQEGVFQRGNCYIIYFSFDFFRFSNLQVNIINVEDYYFLLFTIFSW